MKKLVSSRKIIRDIIIIVVIAVIVFIAWRQLRPQKTVQQWQHPMDDMTSMMKNQSGDSTSFDFENATPGIDIDGQVFTIGQIDTQAKTFFMMMSGGESGLTPHLKNQARREALKRIMREVVLRKKASEYGIEITPAKIEEEFRNKFEKMGGEKDIKNLMKSFGISRDDMMRRIEKDMLENAVFDAFTLKLKIPAGENPESYKNTEFEKWIEENMENLDVKVLSPEIGEIFKLGQSMPEDMPPHSHQETDTQKETQDI